MEEMSPAVAVTLSLGNNSLCENPGFSDNIEITQLKLMTEADDMSSSPASVLDQRVQNGQEEDDEILSVAEKPRLVTDVELLPLDPISAISLAKNPVLGNSEPIAVEIEGGEHGQVVAKVIALEERNIRRKLLHDECPNTPLVKESLVALQLPSKKDPSKDGLKSVFELNYVPLWGSSSICGHSPEMEDSLMVVPYFMKIPINMFIGDGIDMIRPALTHLTSHFFGVYDGHGGSQVANYCRDRIHSALKEEMTNHEERSTNQSSRLVQWQKVFTSSFSKVDDEVSGISKSNEDTDGNVITIEPIASETVGSTAVVAVVCSSHVIVANCGDSRAVLYRGREAIALSDDHKPNREDECARIEASGGKVIQWNGYRVCGVLAMSRAIGDRYLKPCVIPEPEVTFLPRAKEDECLILATDGLWDVMTNEEACEVARKRILLWHKKNGTTSNPLGDSGQSVDPASQEAAEYLSNLAIRKGSRDNISVIVVDLKARRKIKNNKS